MREGFWLLLQVLALGLLLVILPLGYALGYPAAGWGLLAAVLLLHLAELRITLPLARRNHLSRSSVVLKTMLFGFTWWVPLRRRLSDHERLKPQ